MTYYLIIVLGISLLLQIFTRFWVQDFGVDTWRWLLYAREIRENKFRWPQYIDHYMVKAKYSYPPLLHFLLSLVPNELLYRYNFLVSPFFSLIENTVLYLFVSTVTHDTQLALIASILYACTAANIIENNSLNTRSFGQFLFFLGMISLYTYIQEPSFLHFFYLSVMSFIIIIGHRFSLQIFTVASLVYGFFYHNPGIVFAYFLGFVYAFALTKGRYKDILLGHITQARWHWQQNRANLQAIKLNFKLFIKSILLRNVMVLPLLFWIFNPQYLSSFSSFFVPLVFASFVMAVLTTFLIDLRCLGEGYRYVAYATGPIAIYLANYFPLYPLTILGFALLSLAISIYRNSQVVLGKVDKRNYFYLPQDLKSHLESVFEKNKKEVVFASFPPLLDDYVSYQFSNAKVFFHDNGLALPGNCCDLFIATDPENRIPHLIGERDIDVIVSLFKITLPNFSEKQLSEHWIYTSRRFSQL